ncbi:MAG: translocation/assembly module TamB [Deltaproteobacteria bacterium]|nr:translocation/assembly module TamB [Deltaproteobacteria bacterium]
MAKDKIQKKVKEKNPKKKHVLRKVILFFLLFFLLLLGSAYFLLQSPRFLMWAVQQLNYSIPGKITYDELVIQPGKGHIFAKNLHYLNIEGEKALSIEHFDIRFKKLSVFQGALHATHLDIGQVDIYMKKFPKSSRKGPSNWRSVLQLLLKRISIKDGKVAGLKFEWDQKRQINLDEIHLNLSPQEMRSQEFQVAIKKSSGTWKEKNFSTKKLSFSGGINVPFLYDYHFFVSKAQGNLNLEEIEFQDRKLGNLFSGIQIKGNALSLKGAELVAPETTLIFSGTWKPEENSLKIKLKNDSLLAASAIPRAKPYFIETFQGFQVDIDADIKGKKLDDLSGKLNLKALAKGNRNHDGTPDFKLELSGDLKKGNLQLSQMQVEGTEMKLTIQGNIDLAKQLFDVKYQTEDFNLTTLINAIGDLDLKGRANAQGIVKGSWKNPEITAEAQVEKSSYKFLQFGKVNGNFKIKDQTLTFIGAAPSGLGHQNSVKVETVYLFDKDRRTTVLTSTFTNMEAADLLERPQIKGKITGSFDLENRPDNITTGKLKAKIANALLFDFQLGDIEAEGQLDSPQFKISQLSFQPPDHERIQAPGETLFKFDDQGWNMEGSLLPNTQVKADYTKSNPNIVKVLAKLNDTDLRPIWAALSWPRWESYGTGEVEMNIGMENLPTLIEIRLSKGRIPTEVGEIRNQGPMRFDIDQEKVKFTQVRFASNSGTFEITGNYRFGGEMALKVEGKADLNILRFFPDYFREAEGTALMDLAIAGTRENPRLNGDIGFENALINLRDLRGDIEDIEGKMRFEGNSVFFDNLRGNVREGNLGLNGRVDLQEWSPRYYDIVISAREAVISEPGVYRIIFSGDFSFKGNAEKPILRGTMDINEGVYSRDFNISEFILKPQEVSLPEKPSDFMQKLWLDLRIQSPGELAVKNNIAQMYFRSDLRIDGRASNPQIRGALEVLEGKFKYFTVEFENARGMIDFRNYQKGPYINIEVSKEFQNNFETATVIARIVGFTENLNLRFFSSPPLSRRDILALVFTGALPGSRRGLSGSNIATSVLGSQLTQLVQRPLADSAQIDIFRLEASDRNSQSLSTLVIGKRLSDRLTLEFKTDLGVEDPLQGIQMEYELIDNVLLKGTQMTNGRFSFDLALRFELN